jgi:hypothetical protein
MPDDLLVPDLTFPTLRYGEHETAWNLNALLYVGGARTNVRIVQDRIAGGHLGLPRPERFELVQKIHDEINGKLTGGGSVETARMYIRHTRHLFSSAEGACQPLTLDSILATYLHWTDALVHRYKVVRDMNQKSAYTTAAGAGAVLDSVLGRSTPMIQLTRLRMPPKRKPARGVHAEKQNLQETFNFGHMLQDICDALQLNRILSGPLPIRIPLRSMGELVEWSGYHGKKNNTSLSDSASAQENQAAIVAAERFAAFEADCTLRTRYPLVNLRCEAELLMFIGQTGMNFAQAHQLNLRAFYYASYLDGYQVKDRKHRRGGEVLFEIFKDFKSHFERYLEWRRELFPQSMLLFPFVRVRGRSETKAPQFRLRSICKKLGIRFVSPQALRNTRVNWLLRRSGDEDQTAEMAQHTKETLLETYDRPSQQRAMGEVIAFWSKSDPELARTRPVAPGQCDGQPAPMPAAPETAPKPDCIRPSGCLWCMHHRDIDSQDYVWSLCSFRHLKVIEVSKWCPPKKSQDVHPAAHAIDRITDKLGWFHSSNARRRGWVDEALVRIEEGSYHMDWKRNIESMEGSQ